MGPNEFIFVRGMSVVMTNPKCIAFKVLNQSEKGEYR